ncbi:MAG: S-layer homology domain-containing protein [Clostridiales bacterium]|nr:S-layer homology domain-containing protein [Clostridiales bacterium]
MALVRRRRLPWVAFAMALGVLFGLMPGKALAASFEDVAPDRYRWALPAIEELQERGIMQGIGGNRFGPQLPLTRAQLAALFVRWKELPRDGIGPRFTDIQQGAWYWTDVKAAAAHGLLLGTAPQTFSPDMPVTRAMAAVVAVRSLGLGRAAESLAAAPLPYRDGDLIPDWARGAVSIALELGIMQGSGGVFRPHDPLTRAEGAVVFQRLLHVAQDEVARQAARAVKNLSVEASPAAVAVGETALVKGWPKDGRGYILPAPLSFSASGGTITPDGRFQAAKGGTYQVTVAVPGTSVKKTVTITVYETASFVVGEGLPPAVLPERPFELAVAFLTEKGAVNPRENRAQVTLTLEREGHAPQVYTATAKGGWASFTLSLPSPGVYRYRVSSPGLGEKAGEILAVEEPLGKVEAFLEKDRLPMGVAVPVTVTLKDREGQPLALAFPVRLNLAGGDGKVTVQKGGALIAGQGQLGPLAGTAPGKVELRLEVPGGALEGAVLAGDVVPRGRIQVTADKDQYRAGERARITVTLLDEGGKPLPLEGIPVTLTLRSPGDYDLEDRTLATRGGKATFDVPVTMAGPYGYRVEAPGFLPETLPGGKEGAFFTVLAGPAASFAVHVAPSTLLMPGETASIWAGWVDAYGNPASGSFRLKAVPLGKGGAAGTLNLAGESFPQGNWVGHFVAQQKGQVTWRFSPDKAAPVDVTFRVLEKPEEVAAGKGLWLMFPDWKAYGDEAILQKAVQGNFTHVYLEVATTRDQGFYGGRAMETLISKLHNKGIAFLSWTYPELRDVESDLRWTAEVIGYKSRFGVRADGYAPDIEEVIAPKAVETYAKATRQMLNPLGFQGRLIAITYPPNSWPQYPFKELAPYTDVFAPMSYWHHRAKDYTYYETYQYVRESVVKLRQYAGGPVAVSVIGQTYDMFSAGAMGIHSPGPLELEGAWQAAKDAGALGLSFYRYGTTSPSQWEVLLQLPWP